VRRRLTVAMVLMVFGALVLAGLASLALVAHNTTTQTRHELIHEADELASTVQSEAVSDTSKESDPAKTLTALLRALRAPLRLEGSTVVAITPGGVFFNPAPPVRADGRAASLAPIFPSGLNKSDLQPTALLAGSTVSGSRDGLVYAAVPYTAEVQVRGVPRDVVQVVILTRRPPSALAGAGLWFGLVSILILSIAVLVARLLGRSFVRPLEAAQAVTSQIAGGDLDARVPDPPGTDPELAALAHSINSMAASLDRAQGAERQFLLSVSHDLRTPLTSIRGFAEAIEDGVTADVLAAAGVIASEARRLERLVADLLALAMLEARRFTLQLQPLDLAGAVTATAAGFEPAAAELGLDLVAPYNGAVEATGDPDRVAQVTANLVENALRYASHEVRVTATNGVGRPEMSVQDDGPGIAAEDLPRVFDRLFVSRPNGDRPAGSGLGLAIVAELVSAMGGSVRAESPLGPQGGTRMVVTLPPALPADPLAGSQA
jgi:signal transduction histidine kinase